MLDPLACSTSFHSLEHVSASALHHPLSVASFSSKCQILISVCVTVFPLCHYPVMDLEKRQDGMMRAVFPQKLISNKTDAGWGQIVQPAPLDSPDTCHFPHVLTSVSHSPPSSPVPAPTVLGRLHHTLCDLSQRPQASVLPCE